MRDYGRFFARTIYFPDLKPADIRESAATVIACRSDNDLVARHAELFRDYLGRGGFLIVMGGVRADLIDPRITYVETPTNFQRFTQPDPDSGHRVRTTDHTLHRHLASKDMQWHPHGYYLAPGTADRLVELCVPHSDDRVGDILFDDRQAFKGRLMATTLDPHLHHGGYYIPPATRFLDGFIPGCAMNFTGAEMTDDVLTVLEGGKPLIYRFSNLTLYHGFGFPGGVAHGFKVMQLAFPLFSLTAPPERREVFVRTAFSGPGARDAFEMVTRSASEGRYVVDDDLAQPARGETLMRYVFILIYRAAVVRLRICEGIVRDEFIRLGKKPDRTPAENDRLEWLKHDMAARLLALPAEQVYSPF